MDYCKEFNLLYVEYQKELQTAKQNYSDGIQFIVDDWINHQKKYKTGMKLKSEFGYMVKVTGFIGAHYSDYIEIRACYDNPTGIGSKVIKRLIIT